MCQWLTDHISEVLFAGGHIVIAHELNQEPPTSGRGCRREPAGSRKAPGCEQARIDEPDSEQVRVNKYLLTCPKHVSRASAKSRLGDSDVSEVSPAVPNAQVDTASADICQLQRPDLMVIHVNVRRCSLNDK